MDELGLRVEFESFPDIALAFESLARERSGIELLNVRQDGNRTLATVFVPDGRLDHFERLISDYLEEKRDSIGRARDNRRLVDAIQQIRAASLRALWTDTATEFPIEDEGSLWWEVWLPVRTDRRAIIGSFRERAEGTVVDAWQLASWEDYRDVQRLGRKTRLAEKQRELLWSIFSRVRSALAEQGRWTEPGMFARLSAKMAEAPHPPFDFCVIDEAQDIGVAELRFLAALGGSRPNSLFFAGDLGQRIFQTPFSWRALGVDVRGRSHTLRINSARRIRSGDRPTGSCRPSWPTLTATQSAEEQRSRCSTDPHPK